MARPTQIAGPGLITGKKVVVRLHPAESGTGILFVRAELPGDPIVPARVDLVSSTQRRTTLGGGESAITLVEHLLGTLAGLRIDNCVIELDGPEPPGLDGSAAGFVQTVLDAGVQHLSGRRAVWGVTEPVTVTQAGATVTLHPPNERCTDHLLASYILDYGHSSPIPWQSHTMAVTPGNFVNEVSRCRTFVTEREALTLLSVGVGKHLTARDLLVFGPKGLIDNELRFANEPARHKMLDLIGDLSLTGIDLVGHLVAHRSGHSLNVALAKALAVRARAAGADLPPLRELPPSVRRARFPGRHRPND